MKPASTRCAHRLSRSCGHPSQVALLEVIEGHAGIRGNPRELSIGQRGAGTVKDSEGLGEVLCGERSGSPLAGLVLDRIQHHPQGCREGLGMI